MHAADVMTPDVICATPETPLPELVRLMLDHHISALPVVDNGEVVGIVTEGDLLQRAENGTEHRPSRWLEFFMSVDTLAADYTRAHAHKASEIMTRDVVTVPDTAPLADVAHLLESRKIKRVPVLRDGRLVGIVARRTIRDAFYAEVRRQPWAGAAAAVNAVVADGVVHLWGVAQDDTLRQAFVVAAEGVQGVKAVEDHMDHPRVGDLIDRPNWPSPARP
jgi:CBS domain-containing protein